MGAEQQINQWGQIVAKAWQDEAFKKRLLANPSAVLNEQGLEVPHGVEIRVVENTDTLVNLTLPASPREDELSDTRIDSVAGGSLRVTQHGCSAPSHPNTSTRPRAGMTPQEAAKAEKGLSPSQRL